MSRYATATKVTVTVVVLAVIAAVAVTLVNAGSRRHVTAIFPQTVNLYPGDQVRTLGVRVGTVDSVVASQGQVAVRMNYDASDPLGADATAAIITPTLVGVRYVQLGPAYVGQGAQLPDDATIPIQRTAVPLEWDQIRGQLSQLATTLGPTAQQQLGGPLADVLNTTSANLSGNGPALRDTIGKLSALMTTLSQGRGDLFGTVRNLQVLVRTLRDSDQAVGQFNAQLASVSGVLADNKRELATALSALDQAAPMIEDFIRDNRKELADNLRGLNGVAQTLSDNRQGLADVLQRAPGPIGGFYNIFDERNGAVTAALGTTNFRDPAAFLCGAAAGLLPGGVDNPRATNFCRDSLGPLLQVLRMDNVPLQVSPPPLTENGGTSTDREPVPNLNDLFVPRGPK
ncbi:MAG: phospholipid/cholesterol/gamma-HCH transport system substrate-binding protein [Pseudonocardiales bacterium]|jgi:phospholipid/cholesterol/gamma-HCH transport system substrate-binding protein|nr:phospholipid/cholesterol/gamma-HCH transport system substrate-binding protein [Pseudonocardiales bacterium]